MAGAKITPDSPNWRPPRGTGTRPPFAKGNSLPTTHGARSQRVYGPLAEQLAEGLLVDRPDLGRYPEAVAAWSQSEAQALLFRRHLNEVGPLDGDHAPREAILRWARASESAATKHRDTLGLDPRSEAALARERAAASVLSADLDAIAQAGRDAIAAREAARTPPRPDLAGDVLADAVAAGTRAQKESNARHEVRQRTLSAVWSPEEVDEGSNNRDHDDSDDCDREKRERESVHGIHD